MSNDPLSESLTAARRAVEEAGFELDSPSGVAALQRALDHLLTSPPPVESKYRSGESHAPASSDASPESRLAAWSGVGTDPLRDLFAFDPEGVDITLSPAATPRSKSDLQRRLGLLKLAADRIAYQKEEVDAREVNAVAERYNCMDQNLPTRLTRYESYITRRGRRGSFTYRITHPGLLAARDEIRRLANAD